MTIDSTVGPCLRFNDTFTAIGYFQLTGTWLASASGGYNGVQVDACHSSGSPLRSTTLLNGCTIYNHSGNGLTSADCLPNVILADCVGRYNSKFGVTANGANVKVRHPTFFGNALGDISASAFEESGSAIAVRNGLGYTPMPTNGGTFSGPFGRDATYYFEVAPNPIVNFDANDFILYDRTANQFNFSSVVRGYSKSTKAAAQTDDRVHLHIDLGLFGGTETISSIAPSIKEHTLPLAGELLSS